VCVCVCVCVCVWERKRERVVCAKFDNSNKNQRFIRLFHCFFPIDKFFNLHQDQFFAVLGSFHSIKFKKRLLNLVIIRKTFTLKNVFVLFLFLRKIFFKHTLILEIRILLLHLSQLYYWRWNAKKCIFKQKLNNFYKQGETRDHFRVRRKKACRAERKVLDQIDTLFYPRIERCNWGALWKINQSWSNIVSWYRDTQRDMKDFKIYLMLLVP